MWTAWLNIVCIYHYSLLLQHILIDETNRLCTKHSYTLNMKSLLHILSFDEGRMRILQLGNYVISLVLGHKADSDYP